jgi:ubiquinone/menaquinone biosynthesis C-methylase UbiE
MAAVERLDVDHSGDGLQVLLHNQRYHFALERISRQDAVLEIGTGAGCFSKTLVDYGVTYTGLELDPGACQRTRERLNGRGTVVQGDAQQMPFPDEAFMVLVCLEVLEHLPDYRKAVAEIHRCLKSGGRAIISVPYRKRGGPNPLNPYHLYEPGEAELRKAFERHFEKVDAEYQYFQETAWMTLARKCHARRFLGLAAAYGDLARGLPSAMAKVKIAGQSNGLNLALLLVALKRPKVG